ncbi:hypothetical protein N0V83_005419 [Neocucurbitaria cava]|uniref:Uncharacterized protein n=1 Tax=Neocucurbitaria cava TaxID=798079 RepID=A0A9W9CM80_9PLEO|nr:hypothetical protein N0V83_005419 [Neocucurbitaria cava]
MVMACKAIILAVFCIGMALAAPRAHTGMFNSGRHRDVGAIYPKSGYGGQGFFLLEVKAAPQCMPLSCVTVHGPGDVHNVPAFEGNYQSYTCGTDKESIAQGKILATTPHDASQDRKPNMLLGAEVEEHEFSSDLLPAPSV